MLKPLKWVPDIKDCINWSTSLMYMKRMHPKGIFYDRTPGGHLTGLTFISEGKKFCPTLGSYSVDILRDHELLSFPKDRKMTRLLFRFNENGWCGLKVYNHDDCLVSLEDWSPHEFRDDYKTLILEENEEIFAMKMGMKNNYVQAAHFLVCRDLGKPFDKASFKDETFNEFFLGQNEKKLKKLEVQLK